jgi:hypothetical protein
MFTVDDYYVGGCISTKLSAVTQIKSTGNQSTPLGIKKVFFTMPE